ncbi:MAG: hypothetical protein MUC85_01100 [Anaerolineales bacterium]|jgi:hypothetical protein|nr:hypothetical protein [Anaerolineales bacterium]
MAKLSHPPFDAWLLSDEALTPQQLGDLQEHLNTCEACRKVEAGWNRLERLMRQAEILAPAEGFSTRWQARLEAQRQLKHRRQSYLALLGIFALALLAFAVLAGVIFAIWQSPAQFTFGILHRLTLVMQTLSSYGFYLGDVIDALPGFSFAGMFFFIGFATLLSVLWLVAYQQLTGARRIIQ